MKLDARIQQGSVTHEHKIELMPGNGPDGTHSFQVGDQGLDVQFEEIAPGVYSVLINGKSCEAHVAKAVGAEGNSGQYVVTVGQRQFEVELRDPRQWRRTSSAVNTDGPQEVTAPMPGKIVKVLVSDGQEVERDQGLLVIEAMKMQNELRAPRAGRVERIYVTEGRGVESGVRLLRLV